MTATWRGGGTKWLALIALTLLATRGTAAERRDKIDFDRDVRPILSEHCWSCHGPDEATRQAGLRLDDRGAALAVADSGEPAIVPGNPAASGMITRIDSSDDRRMPPLSFNKPMTPDQRQILKQWIADGAPYAEHWAFVAPRRPPLPVVQPADWARNEIDLFVRHALESIGRQQSLEADRSVWLRRVTLDLTGLPPTPEERAAFLADPTELAFEKVVDRLLASPRHAERMAMQWLDVARYADTNGYNNDELRTMWPWRDWVIDAFARNLPYDQFLTEQLAGDLLPDATISQRVATGFCRNHVLTTEGGIVEEEYRVEYVADRVHTTASVFLALSLQCARCHDHKFDPFTQRDYYRFAAFFSNIPDKVVPYSQGRMAEPLLHLPTPEQRSQQLALEARRDFLEQQLKNHTAKTGGDGSSDGSNKPSPSEQVDDESQQWQKELDETRQKLTELDRVIPVTMVMAEMSPRRTTHILRRGQYDQPGDEVAAGVFSTFAGLPTEAASRLELARWLTHPSHPLTSRVAVNRLWEMVFGTGIVETVEDFGVQGAFPSHPQLLDWLATELVRQGWDQRALLRMMVLSATYRQSSQSTLEQMGHDPRNRWLSRGPRYRLTAEAVRDNALAISGLLVDQLGGPSVKPYQPAGLWEDVSVERREKYDPDPGRGLYRRSMYTFWKRTCPPPAMTAFDAPDRETCVLRRARTNTPLQALVLLNDPTFVEAARKFAERLLWHSTDDVARIDFACQLALTRSPDADELAVFQEMLRSARRRFAADHAAAEEFLSVGKALSESNVAPAELAAWTTVTSLILNLDETISKQ